jgi:hypothetical protein
VSDLVASTGPGRVAGAGMTRQDWAVGGTMLVLAMAIITSALTGWLPS